MTIDSAALVLPPFLVEPVFTTRVWGFHDLRPWYDRVAEGDPIGEVWLTGDQCRALTGPQAGKTLGALFDEQPLSMLGSSAPSKGSPLLIKVIFAKEKLSVQVHPDDKLAQKYGDPRGKTECWYALTASDGAEVAAGLKPGVTLEQIEAGIHDGTLERSLNILPVATGDMIFVDAGTVHAIWPGSILLETQQNCDLTYRMYDYGRPRQLHIEKSIEATRLTTRAGKVPAKALADRSVLIDVEYFRVERIPVTGARDDESLRGEQETGGGLSYLFAAEGCGRIAPKDSAASEAFAPFDLPERGIAAIPASASGWQIENTSLEGKTLELIRITPHWPGAHLPDLEA